LTKHQFLSEKQVGELEWNVKNMESKC